MCCLKLTRRESSVKSQEAERVRERTADLFQGHPSLIVSRKLNVRVHASLSFENLWMVGKGNHREFSRGMERKKMIMN